MNSSFIQNKTVNYKFCQYTNKELNLTVNKILPDKKFSHRTESSRAMPLYKQLITSTSELIEARLISSTVSDTP